MLNGKSCRYGFGVHLSFENIWNKQVFDSSPFQKLQELEEHNHYDRKYLPIMHACMCVFFVLNLSLFFWDVLMCEDLNTDNLWHNLLEKNSTIIGWSLHQKFKEIIFDYLSFISLILILTLGNAKLGETFCYHRWRTFEAFLLVQKWKLMVTIMHSGTFCKTLN